MTRLNLGALPGPGAATATLITDDNETLLRVTYTAGGQQRPLEIPAPLAGDLADLLTTLNLHGLNDLVTVFARAGGAA